jgi:hypothetical protein
LAKSTRADKTAKRYGIEAGNGQERKQPEWKILNATPRINYPPCAKRTFSRRRRTSFHNLVLEQQSSASKRPAVYQQIR